MGRAQSPESTRVEEFSDSDLVDLGTRLLAYAHRYARAAALSSATRVQLVDAQSLEDLVHDCVLLLVEPTPDRHWNKERYPDPFDFLKSAFNSMLYHARRRDKEHREEHERPELLDLHQACPTPELLLIAHENLQLGKRANARLIGELKQDQQLFDMYVLIENGVEKPGAIAQHLGIPVREVYNLAKRIERKTAKIVEEMLAELDLQGGTDDRIEEIS